MNSLTAAVFLRKQLFEQASLEGVTFSELEIQMLCASDGEVLNTRLVSEFETRHNLVVFEAKVSTLLHHAYERLRRDDPEKTEIWERATRALESEDHYLFRVWNVLPAPETSARTVALRRVAIGFVIAVGLVLFFWVFRKHSH